jgi:hypothetical protein
VVLCVLDSVAESWVVGTLVRVVVLVYMVNGLGQLP